MDISKFISIAFNKIRDLQKNPTCNIIKKEYIGDPLEVQSISTKVYKDIPLVYIGQPYKVDDYYPTPSKVTTFYIKIEDLHNLGIDIDFNTLIEFENKQYRITNISKIINLYKITANLVLT